MNHDEINAVVLSEFLDNDQVSTGDFLEIGGSRPRHC